VKSQSERYLGLLEQRLSLLTSLTRALAASRGDFVAMDLESIQRRIGEQEQLCTQIQALDHEITQAQMRIARLTVSPSPPDLCWPDAVGCEAVTGSQIDSALRRIAQAQTELKRLNDAHQSLLRRSRQSIHVLLNLFESYAPTYGTPGSPETGTICQERV
jgi:flagellar biosynthesis/type III secretory pathway chaperone